MDLPPRNTTVGHTALLARDVFNNSKDKVNLKFAGNPFHQEVEATIEEHLKPYAATTQEGQQLLSPACHSTTADKTNSGLNAILRVATAATALPVSQEDNG